MGHKVRIIPPSQEESLLDFDSCEKEQEDCHGFLKVDKCSLTNFVDSEDLMDTKCLDRELLTTPYKVGGKRFMERRKSEITLVDLDPNHEEFPTGLLGCMAKPGSCIASFICPCVAELYVGYAFGRKFVGALLFFLTIVMIAVYGVFCYFENKLQNAESKAIAYNQAGLHIQTNLKPLKTWSLILYLMLLTIIAIRLALYIVMRIHVRSELGHRLRKNPDICNSPDYCAVLWCSSCVLCQTVVAAQEFDPLDKTNPYKPV